MNQANDILAAGRLTPPGVTSERTARNILRELMLFRRMARTTCEAFACDDCFAPHLPRMIAAIERNAPIVLVLPAFPGKSPNLTKVLGVLPDLAERHSLQFLQKLCDRIKEHYTPGARMVLCSDGRVFSDVVGMKEEDVTAYQQELARIIEELSLDSISLFDLDDVYAGLSFEEMRCELLKKYGKPIDQLRSMVRLGASPEESDENQEAHRLFCGITRFLFEDALFPGQVKSRAALQKDARQRSYQVIQRSNAWSELIAELFPHAVRLSIHSQICGSKKLGIRLMEDNNLMTPWHGVAVDIGGRIDFLKHSEALSMGARLVYRNGRASHFEIEELSAVRQIC